MPYRIEYGGTTNGEVDQACVSPTSEILTGANGQTRLAKDLAVGNNIMYYNLGTDRLEQGQVIKTYVHERAKNFITYIFEDGSQLDVTDYHPIYTKEGWKSYTNYKGYAKPKVGDEVKTKDEWKKIEKIETWQGLEDYYDFKVVSEDGKVVNNYFANNTLVQSSFAIFKQLNNE